MTDIPRLSISHWLWRGAMNTKKDIMKIIEEEDVEFIRLQFTDVWGNLKNIAVTPGQMKKVMDNMYSVESSALFDDNYEYNEEIFLHPDLDTFVILPWRPQQAKVGKLTCDVCFADGSLCDMSPRTILKRMIERAKEKGYTFKVSPECEFFLFHTDENGNPTTMTHEKAGYLDVGPVDFGENARREMVLTLEEMGFEVESSHHEKAPAQHEIDLAQAESLETADAVMTFRFAVRSIAKRFGLYATFMPKPRTDVAGSGMHLNFSVYKDGVNIFNDADSEVSDYAGFFIGGIMAHAESMCAITNPIVNSYKRVLAGFNAPGEINWSRKGEKSLIKLHRNSGETKVELRFPDTSANPYLTIAVCIAAGIDGIENRLMPDQEDKLVPRKLPGSLLEAVKLMKQDKVVTDALGEKFVEIYGDIKNKEWNDYMLQVSDWEISNYLDRL